jgi:hypothetical protein
MSEEFIDKESAGRRLTEEQLLEERRRDQLRAIQAAAPPDVDIESLAAGSLAGQASPDRPPVPVWEYLDYQAAHPEFSIEAISRIRFPVELHGGGARMVTSIAEFTAPGPRSPTYTVNPEDIVRLYRLIFEAGAMIWNPQTRTHEEIRPSASYARQVAEAWRRELEARND